MVDVAAVLGLFALAMASGCGVPEGISLQQPGLAQRVPVVRHTLPNGMTFLFVRRAGSPTVSFVTNFRVGAVDENADVSGLAHLFEHMFFKGTTTIGTTDYASESRFFPRIDATADSLILLSRHGPPDDSQAVTRLRNRLKQLQDSARRFVVQDEFRRILTRHGARQPNASTIHDLTNYFYSLPANRAQLWFILESDRLAHPVFREFYTERDVVLEERRLRVEGEPGNLLYQAFLHAAFKVHPYGRPVVGWRSTLERLKTSDAVAFGKRFYQPNNAVVAAVGDINVDSMRAWADRYFAGIPPGDHPRSPVMIVEPRQEEERRVAVEADANPEILIGFHVPNHLDADTPALWVLSQLLTGGRTSRLYQRLVIEEGAALSVRSTLAPGALYPRLLAIRARPMAPHSTQDVEAFVYDELEKLARSAPATAELLGARNRLEASLLDDMGSNAGFAAALSASEALWNDWQQAFRDYETLGSVIPEDIQRVVKKYLHSDNRTVAIIVRSGVSSSGDSPHN